MQGQGNPCTRGYPTLAPSERNSGGGEPSTSMTKVRPLRGLTNHAHAGPQAGQRTEAHDAVSTQPRSQRYRLAFGPRIGCSWSTLLVSFSSERERGGPSRSFNPTPLAMLTPRTRASHRCLSEYFVGVLPVSHCQALHIHHQAARNRSLPGLLGGVKS